MPTLQQVLLLGTERVTGTPDAPHPSLEQAWSALDWPGGREATVLEAAALAGTAALAGFVSPVGLPYDSSAPAEREEIAEAPSAAAALLNQLIESEFRPLLIEWLESCARHRRRVPAFFLPRLLNGVSPEERPALAAVAGARGRWLAAQNPAWGWLTLSPEASSLPASVWETGTDAERLAELRRLRATDPAAGLALLQTSWTQEPPAFRDLALGELARGLSLADVPFLENCLRERRRESRQQAQTLLCRLPESGFAQRMRERAGELLVFKKSFLSKKLELTLPSVFSPDWKADGLEEKPVTGTGEKAHWARQILESVSVHHWAAEFDLSIEALFGLAVSSEWSELLLGAWYRTLRFAPDPEVAEALTPPILERPSCLPPGVSLPQAIVQLLAPCTMEVRWKLAEKIPGPFPLLWAFLPQLAEPTSVSRASALLRTLAPALRDGLVPGGAPQAVLIARCLPTSLRPEAERLLEREAGLTKTAEAFLRALELRAQLQSSFSVPSRP